MFRRSYKAWVFCALAFVAARTGASAQDVWGGGFPNDNVNTATNWVGGVTPPGLTAGTDILEFNSSSSANLYIGIANVSFAGLQLTDTGNGADAYIYGGNGIAIGAGGITMTPEFEDSDSLNIMVPLTLTASQVWSPGPEGDLIVSGTISGSAGITLEGGTGVYVEFDSGSNTFGGGLTVTGAGTVVVPGASGTPFGTGPLSLGDAVTLQPLSGVAVALPNDVTFGDGSGGGPVIIAGIPGSGLNQASITFNGNATFNENTTGNPNSEIDLEPNTSVVFTGTLNGSAPGLNLEFGTVGTGRSAVIDAQGAFGPNNANLDLLGNISVILDGSPGSQTASIATIATSTSTYLGLGANYVGYVPTFLASSQITPSVFQGTLGFDNTSGSTTIFPDPIDMTAFNSDSGLVGLGSTSKAVLTGLITPPGGLSLQSGTFYMFGGGGGYLEVTSALSDSLWNNGDGFTDEPNALWLAPGNGPLTLELTGTNTLSYTGGTYVDGAALVFDTTVPTVGGIFLGERKDSPGYVGVTANSQFIFDGSGGAGTHPQDFINMIDVESQGVVGFDGGGTVSDLLDVHTLPNVYLGTSSSITYSGTIIPYSGTFMFAGVKGGVVTVASPSLESGSTDSVVVGLPTPIESYGNSSQVIMLNNNYYSGGTTLNSGYLYVATFNSIGTGDLTVAGPTTSTADTVGIAPYGGSMSLSNNIVLETSGTRLNYATSPYTLTLTGNISDTTGNASLFVDGPVELDGNNSFSGGVTVNGTMLTLGSDNAVFDATFLQTFGGSTVNFTTAAPKVSNLDIAGSVVNFLFTGGAPIIDTLSMTTENLITFAPGSTPTINQMNSDPPLSGNVFSLGDGTALTFNLAVDPDYHGTIVGPNTSSITLESGTLNLISASPGFSGAVTVDSFGTLISSANGSYGTGAVSVEANGTLIANTGVTVSNPLALTDGAILGGFGTFSPGSGITIQNGSILIPGSATLIGQTGPPSIPVPGVLSFGASTPLTFGTGGTLVFSLVDANGTAGSGYSSVNAAGGLSISATSSGQFNIELLTFAPGTNTAFSTGALNFNATLPYSWTLVSTPMAIGMFNAMDFNIGTSGFVNSIGTGGFYVTDDGTDLILNFSPVPEPSTWALLACGAAAVGTLVWRQRRRMRASPARA